MRTYHRRCNVVTIDGFCHYTTVRHLNNFTVCFQFCICRKVQIKKIYWANHFLCTGLKQLVVKAQMLHLSQFFGENLSCHLLCMISFCLLWFTRVNNLDIESKSDSWICPLPSSFSDKSIFRHGCWICKMQLKHVSTSFYQCPLRVNFIIGASWSGKTYIFSCYQPSCKS